MKKLLILAALSVAASFGQLRELGSLTITNGITWDANPETNVIAYRVYVAPSALATNFVQVATVTTNQWPGDATKAINGQRALYVTAVNDAALESEPSEIVLVTFRAGIPVPPRNLQLYSILTLAATNALPPLPQ